jgi:hypothetical protein
MKFIQFDEVPEVVAVRNRASKIINDFIESGARVAMLEYERGEKVVNNGSFYIAIKEMQLTKTVEFHQRKLRQYLVRVDKQ